MLLHKRSLFATPLKPTYPAGKTAKTAGKSATVSSKDPLKPILSHLITRNWIRLNQLSGLSTAGVQLLYIALLLC